MLDVDFLGMDRLAIAGRFRAMVILIEHTVTQVEENGQLTLQALKV
jgi:hypothetical protein